MLRILIVDDEVWARAELRLLLQDVSGTEVVGEADSVETALQRLQELAPDVMLLDVQLRGGIAFDMFEHTIVPCHVVFVTAHDDHAVRAFEVDALDYLVKPVKPEQLQRALSRALERPRGRGPQLGVHDRVYLKDARGIRACLVSEITHVQAAESYTEVHLLDGSTLLVRDRMHAWEQRLPPSFQRIHRSTLINVDAIERLESDGGRWWVQLRGVAEPLAVSRRLVQVVKDRLEKLL